MIFLCPQKDACFCEPHPLRGRSLVPQNCEYGKHQCSDSRSAADDMPMPPLVAQLRPVCWRSLNAPSDDHRVDGLIGETRDEGRYDHQERGGEKKIAAARIALRHERERHRQQDAGGSHGRQQRVKRANCVLLLLYVCGRRKTRWIEADPNTKHRAHEQG